MHNRYQWDSECRALLLPGERDSAIVQARLKSIAPKQFSSNSADRQFWLNCFQNSLRSGLEGYLNGAGLSSKDRLMRRPMRSPRSFVKDCIEHATSIAVEKLELVESTDNVGQSTIAPTQLGELYKTLDRALQESIGDRKQVSVLPCDADVGTEPSELLDIRRLSEATLHELQCELYAQGSVATNEHIGYSDLDLWLVVSRRALSEASALEELARVVFSVRRYLYDFDPLQHHGIMLATECDSLSYSESFLPVDALARARYVTPTTGSGLLLFPRDSTTDAGIALFNLVCMFRKIAVERTQYSEVHQVKSVLSCFMLLPAFFEGARGRPCFKGDSFNRVRDEVPDEIWSIMDEVSLLREQWQYQPSFVQRVVQSSIRNPFMFEYFMRRGLSGQFGRVVLGEFPDDWRERMLAYAEYLWKAICT